MQTVVRNFPFTSDILKLAFYLFWVNLVVCLKITPNSPASVGHHCFFFHTLLRIYLQPISATSIIVAHSSVPWSFRWSSRPEPRAFTRLKFRLQFRILSSANFCRCGLNALLPRWSSAGLQGWVCIQVPDFCFLCQLTSAIFKAIHKNLCVKHFSVQNFS